MHNDKLYSVGYKFISKTGLEKQETIIDEKNNNKLSPISLSILDSIISKKITIIFSQGPFNLSPIVSCLFASQNKRDVLIGIPKFRFNDSFKKNTEIYFSLMYRKIIDGIPSNNFYFYDDMLWCKGSICEETNEMSGIEVSTRPKHGNRKFKNDYDAIVNEKLKEGIIQNVPKIVLVPIDDITPTSVIGNKQTIFKNKEYEPQIFDPKMVVYESINERKYSFENLIDLINNSYNSNVKLVLHFSWPYLRGLDRFLELIQSNHRISIFHLGKRFCIESTDSFKQPPSDIIHLSLEGNLWELYYSKNKSINYKIVLPPLNRKDKTLTIDDVMNCDWPFDKRIKEIQQRAIYENLRGVEKNIVMFPPILDSFLLPSETKKRCIKNGTWMTIPIDEIFETKTKDNSCATSLFRGLCVDIEKCKDIAYEFQNLFTNTTVSKKTLLQIYLIEKMNHCYHIDISKNDGFIRVPLCIANLHPYLSTSSSFAETINYLANSINSSTKSHELLKLNCRNQEIYAEINSPTGEEWTQVIWKDGRIQNKSIRKLIKKIQSYDLDINCDYLKKDGSLRITIKLRDFVEYFELEKSKERAKKEFFRGFTIYNALIRSNGSFEEKKCLKILYGRKLNNSRINLEIEHRTKDNIFKNTYELQIFYGSLLQMQDLDKELVQNSDLLIPGPIPFNTITGQELVISQGYDALLLPFREVVLFAYPGINFAQLMKQIELYRDLNSDQPTSTSAKDLLFSLKHTEDSKRFTLPAKPKENFTDERKLYNDTPLDSTIRQELMDDLNLDDSESEYIRTLREIWQSVDKRNNVNPQKRIPTDQINKEQIELHVKFDDGEIQNISFPIRTLIRKYHGNEYILTPIDELTEGDQIYYVQSEERESIENYLLRTLLSEEELAIEDLLEPLRTLKIFYENLSSLDFTKEPEIQMKKVNWLSLDEKKNIYEILYKILNTNISPEDERLSNDIQNSIWNDVETNKVVEIFKAGNKKVTQAKLFDLAEQMGLKSYTKNSFKVLCSSSIYEHKHYSFREEQNLLVLGKLVGHQRIIDNYQTINEKGMMVGNFLRQVGRSLKRVASGSREPFNEIDIAIGERLKKCIVLGIIQNN